MYQPGAGMPAHLAPAGNLPQTIGFKEPTSRRIPASQARRGLFAGILPWFYRCWLIGATVALTLLLLQLQAVLDRIPAHISLLRTSVRWAELTWLAPVPLAIILWLGWFIFAEAVRQNPKPVEVPRVTAKRGLLAFAPAKPVRLVFRFVTRGDNVDVLRDSVVAVHQAFARYPLASGPYQIEVISERPVAVSTRADGKGKTSVYVVPPNYVTEKQSRFKARALTYVQEQVRPQPEDWYIYLDEESLIDEKMLAGLYRFIWRSIEAESHMQKEKDGKKVRPAGLIGQGAILYQGGNWFFRGADALRTADDIGRFRLQYALGMPMFGVHGSFIVIRGTDDARLSFDVGWANSITEDAAWALKAWAQGFRFAWVDGYLHEQPPQRARDFVRQRSRWLSGIRAVLHDTQIRFPYRICLGIFAGLWQLAFLPLLVAVVALFVHASPFVWMRIPADFAWATFVLAYLQGTDVQAKHSHPFLQRKSKLELQSKRIVSWLLVLCSIWYTLLETLGVLYSLWPKQGFFVISKPSLAAENTVKHASVQPDKRSLNKAEGRRRK
jgi:beta-1,4-mannosyltransferase